ncbi:cobalamin-binding protein [Massilia sp. Dwa41.01b]|uniref:cobalamin-binding protein n=1 Tax=unclassified Massilia TaxID=2609279 RepID=UPI0015FF8424|nr:MULTISPECIES: cobalamin-binding protein [unclassified Massilia]QNA87808.1 cobalamin-binding protein [Massilia sp. Dwa41.01b]QNA98709.1 cobalamin-binding protein [Massilia sp. Se16.2.3]
MKRCILLASLAISTAAAAVTVRDDAGNAVTLNKPALRVISMAPHVTELLFAAGGGERIVGAVDYSDYPEAAKRIPRIGSNREVDIERVMALKPDLIVAWMHGSSERQIDMVRQLGIPVYHSDPQSLEGIPEAVARLGQLMGTEDKARPAAAALRQQLAALRARYAGRPTVRAFYQVWDKPLYTLNGRHIVTDALRLCGGANIFDKLPITAPVVTVESVLQADPEAIFGTAEKDYGGVNLWRQYPTMTAVRNANLFTVDGNLLNRAGPRMIAGAAAMCEKLDLARQHRK